jgi:RNA polymerase sigma-70 factor (ECF subfamily)
LEEEFKRIIGRIQQGDDSGFRSLYNSYVRRIYNFVYRLVDTREDAEDIVQETFIIVHNQIKELKDPDRFESWIYRIARNEVYQRHRRKKGSEISLDDEGSGLQQSLAVDGSEVDPLDSVLRTELGKVIDRVLNSLPFKLREVFILAVLDQLSYEQIAQVVGRSLLSVKTDIHRARVMAREQIKRYLIKSS